MLMGDQLDAEIENENENENQVDQVEVGCIYYSTIKLLFEKIIPKMQSGYIYLF